MMSTIPIAQDLAIALIHIRRHLGRTHPPELSRSAIDEAERQLRCQVPPEVLAYIAAVGEARKTPSENPLAILFTAMNELSEFYNAMDPPQRAWRRDARFDHVTFDAWGDWPRFYAVFGRPGAKPAVGVFHLKSAVFEPTVGTMPEYLRFRWGPPLAPVAGEYYLRIDRATVGVDVTPFDRAALDLSEPVDKSTIDELAPRIVGSSIDTTARVVVHPKFGRGVVRAEVGDRLEIDFGEHGVRTILAQFVRDADAASRHR